MALAKALYVINFIFFQFFYALVLMHLVLLARFVAYISTSFLSSKHVRALSQFLLYIFLLSLAKLAWSQVNK
jgi:hypothetical protein